MHTAPARKRICQRWQPRTRHHVRSASWWRHISSRSHVLDAYKAPSGGRLPPPSDVIRSTTRLLGTGRMGIMAETHSGWSQLAAPSYFHPPTILVMTCVIPAVNPMTQSRRVLTGARHVTMTTSQISHGSTAAADFKRNGMLYSSFYHGSSLKVIVKKLLKSANIFQSHCNNKNFSKTDRPAR